VDRVRAALARLRRLAARVRWRGLIPVVLFGLSILFTVHYVNSANHKFCAVVGGVTSVPVPKPADPAGNPSREKQYELYEQFVSLGRSLGC
jgi:hypothetical protein